MELRHVATRGGRLSSFLKQEMGMSSGLINRLDGEKVPGGDPGGI